ncbi:MAG: MBL fold metallo-hydrolase [Phycisphaeraceae bacterium]|nr:MAG: MBL fold metallo-hydrolase [Phycisphaeraceae bacterium]
MAWRDLSRPAPPPPEAADPPQDVRAALCVLASGSTGNCTLLRVRDDAGRWTRTCLIDAGLSPTRTRRLLAERGVAMGEIDDIILTHLDTDHFYSGWRRVKDCRATLRLHRRHVGRGERSGVLMRRTEPFHEPVELAEGFEFDPALLSHDDLGVAVFRFAFPCGATLGFATDVGKPTEAMIDHLRGVDVLAIESNYCPEMQLASGRPAMLKQRIMGGSGHLSNEQCVKTVRQIGPGSDVVLLHLSRQCNTPSLAAEPHEGSPYRLTVTSHDTPTDWIWIRAGGDTVPRSLFEAAAEG